MSIKLSKDLVESVRKIMEKKTAKLDLVGKEDADIDNDGDTDESDSYLHNRRKTVTKSVKEEVEEVEVNEESESDRDAYLAELSTDVMNRYRAKAKNDPAFEKRKGKVSAARKFIMAKRTKGIETAGKKISAAHRAEYDEHKKVSEAVADHLKNNAGKILEKHGFKKVVDNEKRGVYVKGDHEAGVAHNVVVHKTDKHYSPHHISTYSSTTGWQSSDDRFHADHHRFSRNYHKMADLDHHKAEAEANYENHIKAQHAYHHKHGLEEAVKVADDAMIMEGMNAGDRFKHHHETAKSLLKSIGDHLKNEHDNAMKSKDYKGNKGPNWGHVGSMEHVAQQLGQIHDMLARKGEYAVNESVEIEGLSAEEIQKLNDLAEQLELAERRGRPPKNAKPAGDEANEPRQHIIQQLQRAKLSMQGAAKVRFADGSEHEIHGNHASKLLDKYAGMKPHEKEAFQKKIGASHEGLKSEL